MGEVQVEEAPNFMGLGGPGNIGEKEDVLPEQTPPLNSLEKKSTLSSVIRMEPVGLEATAPQIEVVKISY